MAEVVVAVAVAVVVAAVAVWWAVLEEKLQLLLPLY